MFSTKFFRSSFIVGSLLLILTSIFTTSSNSNFPKEHPQVKAAKMASIDKVKVSNKKISVIKSQKEQLKPKGDDWFDILYPNIWLVGKKKSGKTSVVANILDHCCNKNTVFIFIVSTIDKDETWQQIVKKWRNKGAEVLTYTSFKDPEEGNIIENFISEQQQEAEELKEQEEEKEQKGGAKFREPVIIRRLDGKTNEQAFNEKTKVTKPKIGKGKKIVTPEFVFVFDDQTDLTRDKELSRLLKKNRHFKLMTIISSQDVIDLKPDAQKQQDYVLLFPKINVEKLDKVHQNMGLSLPFDKFNEIYHEATSKPYNFLYISRNDEFRHNFNYKYITDD